MNGDYTGDYTVSQLLFHISYIHTCVLFTLWRMDKYQSINQSITNTLLNTSQTPQYSLSNVYSLVKCVRAVYGYSRLGRGLSRGNFQTLILRHSDKIQYLGICYTSAFKNK